MTAYRRKQDEASPLTFLHPEDIKRHMDWTWRYTWARNPVAASRLWRKYHPGEAPPAGCEFVDAPQKKEAA